MNLKEAKKGVRVVVTHNKSAFRGKVGVIVRVQRKNWKYRVLVDFDGVRKIVSLRTIKPYVEPIVVPLSELVQYKVGDLIEVTEPLFLSGRRIGDVYEVTHVNKDMVHYKYVSGKEPTKSYGTGLLRHTEMGRYWKPHVKAPKKPVGTTLPAQPYAGMYLQSNASVGGYRSIGDIVQVARVLESGSFYYNNLTTGTKAEYATAERFCKEQFSYLSESQVLGMGVIK